MADDDWDLFAVVRSCQPATTAPAATTSTARVSTSPAATARNAASADDALSCLASLTFEEEKDPFSFSGLYEPRPSGFQELQQFYRPFFSNQPPPDENPIVPPILDVGGRRAQRPPHVLQHQRLRPTLAPIRPHFSITPISSSSSPSFGGFQNLQQQQQREQNQDHRAQLLQQQIQVGPGGASGPSSMQPQTPRSRKRKSQQKRTVCHVTAENLSSDVWAWRKYGQKPIKGSPYPRNYYRCSSSKGCAARKQVERSNTDPNIFIVTYTGDHTHPRPTHRNSLAGSTRNKFAQKPDSGSPRSASAAASTASVSSPSSLSPITPRIMQNEEEPSKEETEEMAESDDEDQELDLGLDILIPNMSVTATPDDRFLLPEEVRNLYGAVGPGTSSRSSNVDTDSRRNLGSFDGSDLGAGASNSGSK